MIELMFLKEFVFKKMHQKNVIFVTIDIFSIKALSFNAMPAGNVMTY